MRGPIVYCLESIDNGGRIARRLPAGRRPDHRRAPPRPPRRRDDPPRRGQRLPDRRRGAGRCRGRGDPLLRQRQPRPRRDDGLDPDDRGRRDPPDDRVARHADGLPLLRQRHGRRDERRASTPKNSSDETRRRFTWWDHRGTDGVAQYDFDRPRRVRPSSVYWWDDARLGRHCVAPTSWRLLLPQAGRHLGAGRDPRRVRHEAGRVQYGGVRPRRDPALRIEAKLRPNCRQESSSGECLDRAGPAAE